jgi:hypothetical protein
LARIVRERERFRAISHRRTPIRYTPMRHSPTIAFSGSLAQTVVDLSRSECDGLTPDEASGSA